MDGLQHPGARAGLPLPHQRRPLLHVDDPINACTTVLPRCAALSLPVHFDGHIDYSCDWTVPGGAVSCSFSLNHIQGCISHATWSQSPLAGVPGHEEMSYHIVGPAPFNFTAAPLPQGPMTADSVRSSFLRMIGGFQYQCRAEARIPNIVGANLLMTQTPLSCGCAVIDQCTTAPVLCPNPPLPCYAEQFIQGVVCCPTPGNVFQGFPIGGTPISNTGFRAQSLGNWAGGSSTLGAQASRSTGAS